MTAAATPKTTPIHQEHHLHSSSVVASIEKIFSAKYLFNAAHDLLRSIVSPEEHHHDDAPPLVPLKNLLLYSDIATAVTSVLPDGIAASDEEKYQCLLSAAESMRDGGVIVLVKEGDSGVVMVRRRAFLTPEEDPALRSVVVRPVHSDATAEDIKSFFAAFGAIEDVTCLRNHKVSLDAASKPAVTATVTFASVEAANACATAAAEKQLSYGRLPTLLGQHFVPKLTVMMQQSYLEHIAEHTRASEQKQLHANIIEARKALAAASSAKQSGSTPANHEHASQKGKEEPSSTNHSVGGSANIFQVKKYLVANRAIKCEGLADHVSWQEIKAHIGNLSLSQPILKGAVSLVRILEKDECPSLFPTRTAIIIVKTPVAMEHLVTMYSMATIEYLDTLRRLCPTMGHLTQQEDAWVRGQYPSWTEKRVESKAQTNRKRDR
jgi:hypothetical protein